MNGKIVIAVSIFAATLMLIPGISIASPIQSNVHQYQVGNEKVTIKGKNTFVTFGTESYRVNWMIFELQNASLKMIHFSSLKIRRIKNDLQNSVVVMRNSSNVKIAEIYSFQRGSIDVSIAVKNLRAQNTSYYIVFQLGSNPVHRVYLNGNSPLKIDTVATQVGRQPTNNLIPSNDWSVTLGGLKVSWRNEMSTFHIGGFSTNATASKVSLPFGPIALTRNETYTIDPILSPQMPVPCPGCGGGGESGTPPQLSSFQVSTTYSNTISGGTSIQMTANVNSLGSGGDTLKMYVVNALNGQWIQIRSWNPGSTGSYTETWSATPGVYSYFVGYIYNSYGGESMSSGHSFNVFTEFPSAGSNGNINPGQTYSSTPVYNSQGSLVGYLTLQSTSDFNYPISSTSYPYMRLETSFLRVDSSSGYWVNSVYQNFKWTGNQISTPTSQNWVYFKVQDESYQNYQNGTWQLGEEALYSALTVLVSAESLGGGAIMAALYPIFFHQISQSLPTGYNDINVSHNAGLVATKYGVYYNPLGYSYNYGFSFKDSYIFSFHQNMQFVQAISTSYTSSNAMLNYFEYSAGFKISNGGQGLFGGSLSEPIYIAEYA